MKRKMRGISWNWRVLAALIILISIVTLLPVTGETTLVSIDSRPVIGLPPAIPEEKELIPGTNAFKQPVAEKSLILDNPNYVITLENGWNVISVPKRLLPGRNTAIVVFESIDTAGHSIYQWDGSIQMWDAMGANDIVRPLDGIFIYSVGSQDLELYFDGTQPDPAEKIVYNQWNLIGFWDVYQTCARDTLISIDPGWSYVIGYDPISQGYEPAIFNSDPSRQELMFPGKGYWLWMNGGDTMQYPKAKNYYFGGEYVNLYHGIEGLSDVHYGFENVNGFWTGLSTATNWYGRYISSQPFKLGDDNAWERHWKEGAMDSTYADNVHFAYFHGHGCEEAIKFGTYHDDPTLSYSDVRWGNTMLDWVALDACNVLKDPEETNLWRGSFAGLHGIYSFASNSISHQNRGSEFSYYLKTGMTIWDAWKEAIDRSTPSGSQQIAAVLTAKDDNPTTQDCYYDHLYGYGYQINPPGYPSDFDYDTEVITG